MLLFKKTEETSLPTQSVVLLFLLAAVESVVDHCNHVVSVDMMVVTNTISTRNDTRNGSSNKKNCSGLVWLAMLICGWCKM